MIIDACRDEPTPRPLPKRSVNSKGGSKKSVSAFKLKLEEAFQKQEVIWWSTSSTRKADAGDDELEEMSPFTACLHDGLQSHAVKTQRELRTVTEGTSDEN
jgi:hypothetical protein